MDNALVSSLRGLRSGQSKQPEDGVGTGIKEQLFTHQTQEPRKH